jgi:hypothetical protein
MRRADGHEPSAVDARAGRSLNVLVGSAHAVWSIRLLGDDQCHDVQQQRHTDDGRHRE